MYVGHVYSLVAGRTREWSEASSQGECRMQGRGQFFPIGTHQIRKRGWYFFSSALFWKQPSWWIFIKAVQPKSGVRVRLTFRAQKRYCFHTYIFNCVECSHFTLLYCKNTWKVAKVEIVNNETGGAGLYTSFRGNHFPVLVLKLRFVQQKGVKLSVSRVTSRKQSSPRTVTLPSNQTSHLAGTHLECQQATSVRNEKEEKENETGAIREEPIFLLLYEF